MIDLGISKLALIGAIALIVIGPEKLPRVARMVGTMLGKAQRYVADVKAEVNRSIDLEDLKKMKDEMENAARDVQTSVQTGTASFEKQWEEATSDALSPALSNEPLITYPEYKHPRKKWRLRQAAVPNWFKARSGVRTKAASGAARVARHRPRPQLRA